MRIKRLFWAGLAVTLGETTLQIDPFTRDSNLTGKGISSEELTDAIEPGTAQYTLITHLHSDHYHPETIRQYMQANGQVVCHQPQAHVVEQDGFASLPVQQENPIQVSTFRLTAVPAVDGFGDDQVSWIIEGDGKRVIHCGDTLWHGYWWQIQQRYGPFDLAFLPINGALVSRPDILLQRPYYASSEIPASLTPEQAVAAGIALKAKAVCPIHYGLDTDIYREYPQAVELFTATAQRRELSVLWLQPGEEVHWEQIEERKKWGGESISLDA
ncbi:MBL fold metallo-hydrolase [Ktedonospora formicarum]|uniref:Metallo-beta-lactamase domain-containing protein n=1 Tax=Ktedonospora formicarum TaxID=2778364 RepID=A0A8J3MNR0_9CHLR|nr:MBL fold metallo-hydrolase [Ktedonospora formicarum]GHO42160.1 hypothetical protein KSX_03230 [Ktedonospora formicarum]